SEAAATLCDYSVSFDIKRTSAGGSFLWLDGSRTSLGIASPVLAPGTCKIYELSPEHYKLVWDTGELLDVVNNGTYIDLRSSLPWDYELASMEGLLSSDVNPDRWRVTEGSLFDPVPEPTTLSLLAVSIGLTGIAIMRRGRLPERT